MLVIPSLPRNLLERNNIKTRQTECEVPSPDKTPAFCQKRTSTFFDRKMRPRRRPWLRLTQAACFRVSSNCTLYEVFGNFAWRSAPPRKRVTQSGKALALRDREVPPAGGSRRGARLRGNGDRGNSVRKGVSFTPPLAGFDFASNYLHGMRETECCPKRAVPICSAKRKRHAQGAICFFSCQNVKL